MRMYRRTMRKRRTCGRWRMIGGRRYCCPYDKGHDGDCKPHKREREAKRREELSRLLAEHDDAECAPCAAAARAADRREEPADVIALRCDWARGIVRTLFADHGPSMPERDEERL